MTSYLLFKVASTGADWSSYYSDEIFFFLFVAIESISNKGNAIAVKFCRCWKIFVNGNICARTFSNLNSLKNHVLEEPHGTVNDSEENFFQTTSVVPPDQALKIGN